MNTSDNNNHLPDGVYYAIPCQDDSIYKRNAILFFASDAILPFVIPIRKGVVFGSVLYGLMASTGIGLLWDVMAGTSLSDFIDQKFGKKIAGILKDITTIKKAVGENAIEYKSIKEIKVEIINSNDINKGNLRISIIDKNNQSHGPWLAYQPIYDGDPIILLSSWLNSILKAIGQKLPVSMQKDNVIYELTAIENKRQAEAGKNEPHRLRLEEEELRIELPVEADDDLHADD